jgi:hypothetical protein
MGDDFNALKKFKQEKRADNREHSAALLVQSGIKFEARNLDAHLIVQAGAKIVDFWPGTGLWIVRGETTKRQRGVRHLIDFVRKQGAT